jgi:hypothetical protein
VTDKNEKDLANQLLTEMSEDQVSTSLHLVSAEVQKKSVSGITIPVLFLFLQTHEPLVLFNFEDYLN